MVDEYTVSARRLLRYAQDAAVGVLRWTTDRAKFNDSDPSSVAEQILKSQDRAVKTMASMMSLWPRVVTESVAQSAAATERASKAYEGLLGADPVSDTYRKTLSGFATSPGFGLTREYQAKLGRLIAAWLKYQQADIGYRRLLSATWAKSVTAVAQAYANKAKAGEAPQTAKEALNIWIDIADRTFIETFRTEEYGRAQSSMMNASMEFRRHRRELVDDVLAANDLPTRRDLDEAHRMIYTLRKELKAMKRQLNRLTKEERDDG